MASSRPKVSSALITPAIGFLCLATLVPIAAVVALSFGDFNIAFPEKTRFIGLYNYARFLSDGRFINAALVTFIFGRRPRRPPITVWISVGNSA